MRFFEFFFAVSLLLLLLFVFINAKWGLSLSVYPWLVAVLLLLGVVQFGVEGYRWQFVPAYFITILITLHAFKHQWQPPTTLWAGFGLAGWLLTVVMAWALPIPKLPPPNGSYAVGTTTVQLKDDSRVELYGENAGNSREIMLQIWYPAENVGTKPAPYLDKIELVLPIIGERLGIPTFLLGHLKYAKSHSQPNAPMLNNNGDPFPLLLFSHGYNAFRSQNSHLMETLASHGYVVAAADHTHGGAFTVLDNNRVYLLDPAVIDFDTDEAMLKTSNTLVRQWANDLTFVLDTLTAWNSNDPQAILTNRLDLTQVGAVGQSTGGAAIVTWCKQDTRCLAGLTLDGWFVPVADNELNNPPNIPFLLMRKEGGISKIADGRMRQFYENLQDGYWLTIAGTEHYNYADLPIVSPLANRIGLAGTINHTYALSIQDDYALQFFNHYFRQQPAPLLKTTTSSYSEVSFESQK